MASELNSDQMHEVWRRIIASSGTPPERFEAMLPIILAVSTELRDSDNTQNKPYNVYEDISQSVYGRDIDTDTHSDRDKRTESEVYKYIDTITDTNKDMDDIVPFVDTEKVSNKASDITMPSDEVVCGLVQSVVFNQLQQSSLCNLLSRLAPDRRSRRTLSLISNRDYSSARGLISLPPLKNDESLNFASAKSQYLSPPIQPVRYYRSSLRDAWRNEVSLVAQCTSSSEATENVPLIQALLGAARWHAENTIELKRLFEQNSG